MNHKIFHIFFVCFLMYFWEYASLTPNFLFNLKTHTCTSFDNNILLMTNPPYPKNREKSENAKITTRLW